MKLCFRALHSVRAKEKLPEIYLAPNQAPAEKAFLQKLCVIMTATTSRFGLNSTIMTSVLALSISSSPGAAPPCNPPILKGKWVITKQEVKLTVSGTIKESGAQGTLSGGFKTSLSGNANSVSVGCDGSVSGQGGDSNSGTITLHTVSPDADVTTTYTFSGTRTYTFNGTVQENPLRVRAPVINQSGNIRIDVTTQGVAGGFPFGGSTTSSQTLQPGGPFEFRISAYDAQAGIIKMSLDDNPWFQEINAALASLNLLGVNLQQEGEIQWENHTPILESAEADYKEFYLKDVGVNNRILARINWHKTSPPHSVKFTYGSEVKTVVSDDPAVDAEFDMGKTPTSVSVVAEAEGQETEPIVVPLKKVEVPKWAAPPADFSASRGITYRREIDWPEPPQVLKTVAQAPLVGGVWQILGNASSKVKLSVSSEGTGTANLEGDFQLWLPKLTTIKLNWMGTGAAKLNDTGLEIPQADVQLNLPSLTFEKDVSIFDLIQGAEAPLCNLSQTLCNVIRKVGAHAELNIAVQGKGQFHSTPDKLEWTQGEAKAIVDASVLVSLTPPPVDALIVLQVGGGGTACGTIQFYPAWDLKDIGFGLRFNAQATVMGVGATVDKKWDFLGGCGGGAAPASLRGAMAIGDIPPDGQPALAIGPNGRMAVVWSGLSPSAPNRPSGDIYLKLFDPQSKQWGAPILLTNDIQADQAPSIVFLDNSKLLVAWQRNPSPVLGDASTLPQFASGFEIQAAAVDAANGAVLASTTLTSNSSTDFGPHLNLGQDGTVLLVWQRASGADFLGSAQKPASIHSRIYRNGQWTAEATVVNDLKGVFGWNAALLNQNKGAVAFVLDKDGDFGTDQDSEIFLAIMENGLWGAPRQLTSNAVSDWAPQVLYLPDGQLTLGWLRDNALVGATGSFDAPQLWLSSEVSPGSGFSHGQILLHPRGLMAIWPRANDFFYSTSWVDDPAGRAPNSAWSIPKPLASTPEVEVAGTASVTADGQIQFASLRAPVIRGEIPHLGAATSSANTITLISAPSDTDGDGLRDQDELVAGTDPRDKNSVLKLLRAERQITGAVVVHWLSVANKKYAVESSSDLKTWMPRGEAIATSGQTSFQLPSPADERVQFFRIRFVP